MYRQFIYEFWKQVRLFGTSVPIQPLGLSINSVRRELYITLQNGDRLGVFNLNGQWIDDHPLPGLATIQGIGTGRRL